MKAITFLMILGALVSSNRADAQILKNLAKKAEKAAERALMNRADRETEKAVDNTMDSIWGTSESESSKAGRNTGMDPERSPDKKDYNNAKNLNTELKRSFYTHDVVIHTVNQKGETGSHYFDADELAMKGVTSTGENPIYIDSEAFQYAYNEHESRWEKTGLMQSDAMSFMVPMLSIGMVKLPPDPMLEAVDRFKEQGLRLNTFMIVEWAFIYKPDDFRMDGYNERTVPCEDGGDCVAFDYEDPEYQGTYVVFDGQGRLAKIYARIDSQMTQEDGSFEFDYETPVSVTIPSAVEVKMPFQDILSKGLDVDEE